MRWDKNYISVRLHALADVLRSPEKLYILTQNIYILLLKYCVVSQNVLRSPKKLCNLSKNILSRKTKILHSFAKVLHSCEKLSII